VSRAAGAVGASAALVGVGIDAVDIARFRQALQRRPQLGERLFSAAERAEAAQAADPVASLATRFAAKEAVMKALGTGLWAYPVRDVEVLSVAAADPVLRFGPRAAACATDRGAVGWYVSLTVDRSVAMAVVSAAGAAPAEAGSR